jgi:hypothetical protein
MPSPQPKKPEPANEFDLSFIPQPQLTGHAWRQQGTQLVCESCPFTHSSYIPVDYQLYGIDDNGMPQIRKLKF